jgi:Major Facilitator Superfamily
LADELALDRDVEKATMRRVILRLVPFLMVCYFFALLDHVNVGFAALQMNKDLGLTPSMFGFAASLFFVSYFLIEVPSNLALQKVGARRWIARIMVTWGLVTMGMAFVVGPLSLYVMRFIGDAAGSCAGCRRCGQRHHHQPQPRARRGCRCNGLMARIARRAVQANPVSSSKIAIDQGARVLDSEGEQLLGQDCDDVGREKVAVFGRDLDPRRLAIVDCAGRLKRADESVGDNRLRRHRRQAEQVAALKILREPDPPPVGRVHDDAIGREGGQRGLQDSEPEHVGRGRRRTRKQAA